MRLLYDNYRWAEQQIDTLTMGHIHLWFTATSRGKYENGLYKSNGSYTSFGGNVYFPLVVPFSEYSTVTVWATLIDNLSVTVKIGGVGVSTSLVTGVSTPVTLNYARYNITNSTNTLAFEFASSGVIVGGIRIDKVEFVRKELYPAKVTAPPVHVDTNVMLGSGIKQAPHPMLESYYIEGQVSLKGKPVSGALLKITPDTVQSMIIPTQPNGKYRYYTTTAVPMTLVAYSQWHNHNSMVRENVRPNSDFRSSIGQFVYS